MSLAFGLLIVGGLLATGAAPPAPAGGATAPARVSSVLEDVLAAPEYRRLRRAPRPRPTAPPIDPAAEAQGGGRPGTPGSGRSSYPSADTASGGAGASLLAALVPALRILVYAALAVAVIGLIVLIVAKLRGGAAAETPLHATPDRADTAPVAPGERSADEYLQQALVHARAGRHREAIRLLLTGAMGAIERAGLIRHRQGLTNGDYLRAVSRDAPLRAALEPIVLAFDEIYFGRRGASGERFELCLRHYKAAFMVR